MKVAFYKGVDLGRQPLGTLELRRGKLVAKGGGAMLSQLAEGLMKGDPRVFAVGGKQITVKAGDAFLKALPLLFRPPYFFAEVVEKDAKKETEETSLPGS